MADLTPRLCKEFKKPNDSSCVGSGMIFFLLVLCFLDLEALEEGSPVLEGEEMVEVKEMEEEEIVEVESDEKEEGRDLADDVRVQDEDVLDLAEDDSECIDDEDEECEDNESIAASDFFFFDLAEVKSISLTSL